MNTTDQASTRFEPGAPARPGAIPLSVPEIGGNEWAYVKQCLDTGWVSSVGAFVDRFQDAVAAAAGLPYAVATTTGTAALQVALHVAGIGEGDEVVMPALTFIAPANAVRYRGAWPVFVDVEPEFAQIDPDRLEPFLRACERGPDGLRNPRTGRPVRAVLPVDLLGHPCDIDRLTALAREFGLIVIEDATESLGARYRGQPVGSRADIACFSFNGNKILTTGGGGMIVTPRAEWAVRARYLTTQAKDDPIEFVHGEVGYNHRLTNVQAAIGCAQMERLGEFVERKRAIAARYARALADVPGLTPMVEAPWASSTYWLYTVRIDPSVFGCDRTALMHRLADASIQARPLWQPLHVSPALAGSLNDGCPVAEHLQAVCLSLPSSVGLTPDDQDRVIDAVLLARRGAR